MDTFTDSVGILLPTKARYEALSDSLISLSLSDSAKELIDVVVVADQDKESFLVAQNFPFKERFRSFSVHYSEERLFPVKAFNFAFQKCSSRYFCMMNDENTYSKDWLVKSLCEFDRAFPDRVGLLSLYKKKKAGLCLSTQDFIKYNGGELYNSEYTLYYSDDELTMRAILYGRYKFLPYSGVFHDEEITRSVSAIPWEEKIRLKKIDRSIFYQRLDSNFGLLIEEIYPWAGFEERTFPLLKKGWNNGEF